MKTNFRTSGGGGGGAPLPGNDTPNLSSLDLVTSIADLATATLVVNVNGAPRQIKMSDWILAAGVTEAQLPQAAALGDTNIIGLTQGTGAVQTTLGMLRSYLGTGGAGATPDTTAPVLTSPTASATGQTTATGTVTTSEGNGTLFVTATPNPTESVLSVTGDGIEIPITSAGNKVANITGLNAGTVYYMHFVHRDAAGNDSLRVSSGQFTTAIANGDTTAPVLTLPTGTANGQNAANGSVSTNEANGTLYRYISTNAAESQATVKAANLTSAVTGTGVQNVAFTNLAAGTTYYAHYLHRDAAGNDSAVVSSASFTTATATLTQYTFTPYNNNAIRAEILPSTGTLTDGTHRYYSGTDVAINLYWNITPTPPSLLVGWGDSAVTPPASLAGTARNTASGGKENGLLAAAKGTGNAWNIAAASLLWAPINVESPKRYLWAVPSDGAPFLFNPAGSIVKATD